MVQQFLLISGRWASSVALAAAFVSGFAACQKKPELAGEILGEALMADRPVVEKGSQFFLIELRNPALASTAERNSQNVTEVDAELKKKIESEQALVEAQLQQISKEIRVIFRYKYVLNGLAIAAPVELREKILELPVIQNLQSRKIMKRPRVALQLNPKSSGQINPKRTSVTFIGSEEAYQGGIRGQGIRVGVLDTGLDYTHSMLGGSGLVSDYESVDPQQPSQFFPNRKVVGGIDLVGSRFDTSSLDWTRRIPKPDANPMDEGGHGSHVAGSIAGLGDGVKSYDGVAPEASLYAIKVFGGGSTSDEVVIAGLEWSVDPNQDGELNDQLHVVNLSLGGNNGTAYDFYNKAVANLSKLGTLVVASAGNDSNIPFIVGSPSTADDALSVAAQIDDSDHNWRFRTVGFFVKEEKRATHEIIEAAISKPLTELESVKGEIVFGGLADRDFSEEESQNIRGQVLLVDRGGVTFQEKLTRGEKAGAIAVIVAQNRAEPPFTMGGEGKVAIPAIMISQEMGQKLKAQLEKGEKVVADLLHPEMLEKPELIGQITDFSSRGPRSYDLLIKPEITAPGQNIISAAMGQGTAAMQMSGTSMSGPHVAGVMALMKQKYPRLTTRELKSVVMSTAIQIQSEPGVMESVARQGAGQVMVGRALRAQFVTEPQALSLGFQQILNQKRVSQSLRLKSLSDDEVQLNISLESSSQAVSMESRTLTLKPQGLTDVKLVLNLNVQGIAGLEDEVAGWVVLQNGEWKQKIPFLIRLHKISNIKVKKIQLGSESELDAEGSEARIELLNQSPFAGEAWLFNLLGLDDRKEDSISENESTQCDLKAVGYRITQDKLEIGIKLYQRLTSWPLCEISVLFDRDGDRKVDAELALTPASRVGGSGDQIVSSLLDFKKAQDLRAEAEKKSETSEEKVSLNLASALLAQSPAVAGDLKSAVTLQVNLDSLKAVAGSQPRIQVIASSNDSRNVESDDFLKGSSRWHALSLNRQDQSWLDLKGMTLQGQQSQTLEIERGAGRQSLLLIYPNNSLDSRGVRDEQLFILRQKSSASPAELSK